MKNSKTVVDPEMVRERLERMGIQARLMKGGRTVLSTMRLGPQPFDTPAGPVRIENVVFASVGHDRIKCLRPRALFQLPMLRVLDCRDATAVEARIRLAWSKHVAKLRDTGRWLDSIGADYEWQEDGSLASLEISGEEDGVRARAVEPRRMILPGSGRLSGVALQRAEDRTLVVDPALDSSVDLEIAVSNRVDQLKRLDDRLQEARRNAALKNEGDDARRALHPKADWRIMLVGPRLAAETAAIESLRLRSYDVHTARTTDRALELLATMSPELVMADMEMGRADGLEIIPALRRAPGIEEIPVVLVDGQARSARRDAARRIGAAGYVVHPIEVARIAKRIAKMIEEPRRRRFTRFAQRLSARIEGRRDALLVTSLGRGGMFVACDEDWPAHSFRTCRVSLPELGAQVSVETEVLYRVGGRGSDHRGHGVRFHHFTEGGESTMIEYVASLARTGAAPG